MKSFTPLPQRPTFTSGSASAYAWAVLALLCLIYVMNFLDRTLIYILFPPIKREMLLSDVQLALLGSTSFVIFYTLLGIPFGRLADRVKRTTLIASGVAVWSIFSGLTGFAHDFWTIFLCRVMVGVGEATLGPAAMSLLSDYFPPERRATAQSLYSAGIPIGAAAAFFLGGWIAQEAGWRWAFYLLGFPGLGLAALMLFVREPERSRTVHQNEGANSQGADSQGTTSTKPRYLAVLRSNPALKLHHIGYALFTVATNSLSIWVPTLFSRVYGLPLASVGVLTGVCMLLAGGSATAFGGYFADKFKQRSAGGRMMFTSAAAAVCIPLWLVFLLSGNVSVMTVCYFFLTGFGLIWLGPAAADVHDIVGERFRGVGIGAYFFTVNAIGYGIAPPVIGRINDALGATAAPAQMTFSLLICPAACALSAVLLFVGSRAMNKATKEAV
jgi:MFS family permease